MAYSFEKRISELVHAQQVRKRWVALLLCLAILVGLGTVVVLRRDGVAMTKTERVLDCAYAVPTGDGYAGYAVHTHTADCYDAAGNLVCPLPEIPAHVHNESCWSTVTELVCGQEETQGHTHDENCYTLTRGELICGLEESEEHEHSDTCYDWVEALTCGQEEFAGHVHADACYVTESVLTCGQQELHTHSADCYDGEGNRICGLLQLEEHVHGPACFREVETPAREEEPDETLPELTLGGGLAVIEAADGEPLPAEAAGYAYPLAGQEATAAEEQVKAFLAEQMAASAKPRTAMAKAKATASVAKETRYEAFEIGLENVDAAAYEDGFRVTVTLSEPLTGRDFALYHIGENGVEALELEAITEPEENGTEQLLGFSFVTPSFSPFVLSYTVDFHYEVDGQVYEFSLTGGETIALSDLIEVLGILDGTDFASVSEFVAQVENVAFSDEGLVKVTRSEGDWELESLQPFSTEEELTITMKNGNVVTVRVTDAQIRKTVIDAKGDTWEITVTYGEDAQIPDDAKLQVSELTREDTHYEAYKEMAAALIESGEEEIGYIRIFDISILDAGNNAVEPEAPVEVQIRLLDKENTGEELQVIHFAESADTDTVEPELLGSSTKGDFVDFQADSFSVYAIVEGPGAVPPAWETITTLDDLKVYGAEGLYIGQIQGYWMTDETATNTESSSDGCTGILKTRNPVNAVKYYFEPVDGMTDQFYVYFLDEDNNKTYIRHNASNENTKEGNSFYLTTDESQKTAYQFVYKNNAWTIQVVGTNNKYWNMRGGTAAAGNIISTYTSNSKPPADNNFRFNLCKGSESTDDIYQLDGKPYGLMNYKSDISGYLMMADAFNTTRLERKWTLIREDPLEHDGPLFIAENAEATMWTFHSVSGDVYYLTTEIDGDTKFLNITSTGLSLVDSLSESCHVSIVPGTGSYAGKIKLVASDGSVVRMFDTAATNGFGTTTASENANDWMNLVVRSNLSDEDFVTYSAQKVSVSDNEKVSDGGQVIVYTRVWNGSAYEYYAIDHDGTLVRVYENGSQLQWTGTRINTLLWDFTEYKNADGTLNYYYELQNSYSEKYLAPQIQGSQVLSDNTIGLNLNGRRYEEYTTSILAWDDPDYQYSGLKVVNGQLVPCPLDDAEDFYFAVMVPETEVKLTTVDTVNNNDFGITMKMQDYNNEKTDNYMTDTLQADVMGSGNKNKAGLVKSYLGDDTYPIAADTNRSLIELFSAAQDVNHLFLAKTYYESGYFEYDSMENFAHLVQSEEDKWVQEGYSVGDFVLYDQVGTVDIDRNDNVDDLKHGQFLPYNDLDGTDSQRWTMQTTTTNGVLPYTDPRKDKPLYAIPFDRTKGLEDNNADYHFGMEMTATFTQTADGLDAWGHDIIFEFAGDDDMYFFVDDILVLDLGGVHNALTGTVNFRTGGISGSRANSNNNTLLKCFQSSYKAQYPDKTAAQVNEWLEGIFKKDAKGNLIPVFQDYSTHTMRMIFMERRPYASNLHLRFNLAAVKKGTVQLSKQLSGVTDAASVNAEFPYQIWYSTRPIAEEKPIWHLLGEKEGEAGLVKYLDSSRNVKYSASYSVAGVDKPYEHVFFLKHGETAEITVPDGTLEYRIVECGVNPNIYDVVKANDAVIEGSPPIEGSTKKDYRTSDASPDDRQTVTFDNHIKEGAMRTLSFTKTLYDVNGEKIENDSNNPIFDFRLALGSENDTSLTLANMQPYYVKDQGGNYCKWDNEKKTFVSLKKTDFANLKDTEKQQATFHTSINGMISYIPVGYTVEVRQLLIGSKFNVTERDYEVPAGYSWRKYLLNNADSGVTVQNDGVTGTIPEDENASDPTVEIQNYKGWGITVKKVWTDADFMDSHDAIYFAVYTKNGEALTYVPNTLRQMSSSETSRYWYFDKLSNNASFEDHVIREVEITNGTPTVNDNGFVTNEGSLIFGPVDAIAVKATPTVTHEEASFDYTVTYQQGDVTETDDNIRVDTITNARPGIRIIKEDWSGSRGLSGAVFTLKMQQGGEEKDIGRASYTSDADGLVTIAYLPEGTFTLTEISSPTGYAGLTEAIEITNADGTITLSGQETDSGAYSYTPAESDSEDAVITIKNKPFTLKAVKVDASNEDTPLQGVHFALYRQVTASSGEPIKDYNPMEGYTDLVSGADGVIPDVTQALSPGTYYLHESQALDAYEPMETDICFTISKTGVVTMENDDLNDRAFSEAKDDGTVTYTITVKNAEAWQKLQIRKVDIANPSKTLQDAKFDLYKVGTDGQRAATALYTDLTSNREGMLEYTKDGETGVTVLDLPVGVYHLVETSAPAGYNRKTQAVVITVTSATVTYDEGTTLSQSGSGRTCDPETNVYTLTVSNATGYELPRSGGVGTGLYTALGGILIGLAAVGLLLTRKRRTS